MCENAYTVTTSRAGVRVRGYGWYRPKYEARYAGRRMLSGFERVGLGGEDMVAGGELDDKFWEAKPQDSGVYETISTCALPLVKPASRHSVAAAVLWSSQHPLSVRLERDIDGVSAMCHVWMKEKVWGKRPTWAKSRLTRDCRLGHPKFSVTWSQVESRTGEYRKEVNSAAEGYTGSTTTGTLIRYCYSSPGTMQRTNYPTTSRKKLYSAMSVQAFSDGTALCQWSRGRIGGEERDDLQIKCNVRSEGRLFLVTNIRFWTPTHGQQK
ncbi:hypothetical protein EI94DRAFT_1697724 [Lactarius quietus]|nr:hypothetical protein EI94DRAFT_1697724 [Lactarius quietus]